MSQIPARGPTLRMLHCALGLSGVLALLPTSALAGVIVIAPSGGNFSSIAPAVAAATDGDTLLVKAGSYGTFTVDGKALSVVADTGAGVNILGTVTVKNLAAGQQVVLTGLNLWGPIVPPSAPPEAGTGLWLSANQGAVRVERCILVGATGMDLGLGGGSQPAGRPAAIVASCSDVTFTHCTLFGGPGDSVTHCFAGNDKYGGNGGSSALSTGSIVAFYDSLLRGGAGGCGDSGGDGGHAISVSGFGVFASGS